MKPGHRSSSEATKEALTSAYPPLPIGRQLQPSTHRPSAGRHTTSHLHSFSATKYPSHASSKVKENPLNNGPPLVWGTSIGIFLLLQHARSCNEHHHATTLPTAQHLNAPPQQLSSLQLIWVHRISCPFTTTHDTTAACHYHYSQHSATRSTAVQ